MTARPLADAVKAATVLWPQIVEEVLLAEHADEPRAKRQAHLDTAIERARELVTRLELARDLYASTPPALPMMDSSAWTGRR